MAAQALYRRWRSQTFAEIIGQEHITHTLLNALRAGRAGHAYLFSGPRGTGKTTTARVLAKALNCLDPQNGEPCNRCRVCTSINEGRSMDLIEIDAASNRNIDDVREIREKIAFSPSEGRYKVYIIDEVHQFHDFSFNALLKILEEPPPHAVFILATTEPHDIPDTILSRCQRYDFRRVPLPQIVNKLTLICEREGIETQPGVLDAIARHAAGSFRDAESLLDQLASIGRQITLEDVQHVLGAAPYELVSGLVTALVQRDIGAGLRIVNESQDQGIEPRQFTQEILEHMRQLLLLKTSSAALLSVTPEQLQEMTAQAEGLSLRQLVRTIRLLNQAANEFKTAARPQILLELAVVESLLDAPVAAADPPDPSTAQAAASPPPAPAASPSRPVSAPRLRRVQEQGAPLSRQAASSPQPERAAPRPVEPQATPPAPSTPPSYSSAPELSVAWLKRNWSEILKVIRPQSRELEAVLKDCQPFVLDEDCLTLGFFSVWHRDRAAQDNHRAIIEDTLASITGRSCRLECTLASEDYKQQHEESEEQRKARLAENPVVKEAVEKYGAKIVDIQ